MQSFWHLPGQKETLAGHLSLFSVQQHHQARMLGYVLPLSALCESLVCLD